MFPVYLTRTSLPLANQTFADVESESVLKELHDRFLLRYNLLDRVVRARKLHHSRLYADNLDYGHARYLDTLQSQKFVVLQALERLERRTSEVVFGKQNRFR